MRQTTKMVVNCLLAMTPIGMFAEEVVYGVFNSANVILPSSYYTPNQPYQANVWVHNTNTNYSEGYYNHIWAMPDNDSAGHKWYEPEYSTEDVLNWGIKRAPFSSDATYLGQTSYQWVTLDKMGELYMRRTFTLDAPLDDSIIYMTVGHDDAPSEWYLNGELIHTVSDGWDNGAYIELTEEQKALIKTDGTENLLAVHVHQNWGGAFADCGLYKADMYKKDMYLGVVNDGEWPCKYYFLNYQTDLAVAESKNWASLQEDESDWIDGVGPFSNDANMFDITRWPSELRPILIRRHFNLSSEELTKITEADGAMVLTCSYDENPKVYLNGKLIWSKTGWNDNDYASYTLTKENINLLTVGDNVLAVSLSTGGGGGHIDYGLSIQLKYVSGITLPIVNISNQDGRIYDLLGHYLGTSVENLSTGIYIINGKKQLIRK